MILGMCARPECPITRLIVSLEHYYRAHNLSKRVTINTMCSRCGTAVRQQVTLNDGALMLEHHERPYHS